MDLSNLREKIDAVDNQMAELLRKRLDISEDIARYKLEKGLPVYDPERERQKRADMARKVGDELAPATDALLSLLFDLSRSRQYRIVAGESQIKADIRRALAETDKLFPTRPLVACQGVEGAYSQQACDRIFPAPSIMYFNTFEGVFSAIEHGLCRYGVLPVENSTAGSVNRIYDLMIKHNFYIVRSARLKVNHCLLAKKGAKLEDIKEIFSHEQAIMQCEGLIKRLSGVKVTPCENTAIAAKMVFESGRSDAAALSSRNCAELYGLDCLLEGVQDQENNYTRFICISKKLEIYPGAGRTSLMMVLPNKQGSLYRVLSRFNALGINLLKLESRPMPSTDFEFLFYFDIEIPAYSDDFLRLFDNLEGLTSSLKYLGTYSEVV